MISHTLPVTGYNKYGAKSTHMRPLLKAATIYATNATAMGPAVYQASESHVRRQKLKYLQLAQKQQTQTHTHTYIQRTSTR